MSKSKITYNDVLYLFDKKGFYDKHALAKYIYNNYAKDWTNDMLCSYAYVIGTVDDYVHKNLYINPKHLYNNEGFNMYGIHKDTNTKYNPSGFMFNGLNNEGYDKDGYDSAGYNKNGYDVYGNHR